METVHILEWIKTNFYLVLIGLGIFLIVIAILGGNIRIGESKIGVIGKKQAIILGSFGLLLSLIGTGIFLSSDTTETIIPPDGIPDPKPLPVPEKTVAVDGELIDVFGNSLTGQVVRLYNDEKNFIYNTDSGGKFIFTKIQANSNYTLASKECIKKITVGEEHSYNFSLVHNPLQQVQAVLCSKVDSNRNTIVEFDKEHAVISRASLPIVENEDYEYRITCFIRLYGSLNVAKQNLNTLDFEWRSGNHSELQNVQVKFSESGYRTWTSKRVWKGRWTLEIKTKTGKSIDNFIFDIN